MGLLELGVTAKNIVFLMPNANFRFEYMTASNGKGMDSVYSESVNHNSIMRHLAVGLQCPAQHMPMPRSCTLVVACIRPVFPQQAGQKVCRQLTAGL